MKLINSSKKIHFIGIGGIGMSGMAEFLTNHKGPIVCESGIKSEKEVQEILKKTKINNFLIGESLLKDLEENSSLLEKIVQLNK